MATASKKTAKTAPKKAPSKAQLAARAKFAAMAKAKKIVAKRVVSVNSEPSKMTKRQAKTSSVARIPGLGVKPLSKPAYAETSYLTRGKREPVVKDRTVKFIDGTASLWM